MYRKRAIFSRSLPEVFDDPLKVTAPHERIFTRVLLALSLVLLAITAGAVLVL